MPQTAAMQSHRFGWTSSIRPPTANEEQESARLLNENQGKISTGPLVRTPEAGPGEALAGKNHSGTDEVSTWTPDTGIGKVAARVLDAWRHCLGCGPGLHRLGTRRPETGQQGM